MMTLFKSPVQLCLKLILRKSTGEKRKQVFTLHCIQALWNESIDSLVWILERWKLFYPINMDWSCDFFGQCSDSGGGGVHFLFPSESAQDAAKLGIGRGEPSIPVNCQKQCYQPHPQRLQMNEGSQWRPEPSS